MTSTGGGNVRSADQQLAGARRRGAAGTRSELSRSFGLSSSARGAAQQLFKRAAADAAHPSAVARASILHHARSGQTLEPGAGHRTYEYLAIRPERRPAPLFDPTGESRRTTR